MAVVRCLCFIPRNRPPTAPSFFVILSAVEESPRLPCVKGAVNLLTEGLFFNFTTTQTSGLQFTNAEWRSIHEKQLFNSRA